ncbi:MAG: porphobilinogen deaminase, partial [Olpidium bornovanus]
TPRTPLEGPCEEAAAAAAAAAPSFVLGSRNSQLALVQTEHVRARLLELHGRRLPDLRVPVVSMSTTGDRVLDVALSKIGDKGLFTKELEAALAELKVDAVVHSLKDLPTTLPPGMAVAAVLEREDPCDAVVVKRGSPARSLDDLPDGAVLDDPDGPFSAIILAYAGLHRLGWRDRATARLAPEGSMHAVGQGALAVECRKDDARGIAFVAGLDHRPTRLRCLAERSVMRALEGGCSVPIGVHTEWVEGGGEGGGGPATVKLRLRALVVSVDGADVVRAEGEQDLPEAATPEETDELANALGVRVAADLLRQGADEILRPIKEKR